MALPLLVERKGLNRFRRPAVTAPPTPAQTQGPAQWRQAINTKGFVKLDWPAGAGRDEIDTIGEEMQALFLWGTSQGYNVVAAESGDFVIVKK